MKEQKQCNLMS